MLFDLDGTLWDRDKSLEVDWERITGIQATALAPYWARWGFTCSAMDVIPAFINALAARRLPEPDDYTEPPWHGLLQATLATFGHEMDEKMADNFIDIIDDVPFHEFGNAPFPDSAPALEALAARELRIGAVTNNPKKAARMAREIRDQGLPDVFEVIVTSMDCGWRKPHHEPFRLALEALGVSAAEAMHVGDSWENDIVPALELGMMAVQRVPAGAVGASVAEYHAVSSLLELLPLLDAKQAV